MAAGKSQKKKPDTGNAAFSPRFSELIEALESLYITGNLSGRLKFREAWPLVAEKIFGPELMAFDAEGTKDKERRAALEQEAEINRQNLLSEFEEIKEKSLKNSMLELDYIKATIRKFDRAFAALIYPENILEKFAPAPPSAPQARPVAGQTGAAAAPIDQGVEDLPDDIAPIDAGAGPAGQPGAPTSPLNLGQRKRLMQIDPTYSNPISYDELVVLAEAAERAKPAAVSLKPLFNGLAAAGGAAKIPAAPGQ